MMLSRLQFLLLPFTLLAKVCTCWPKPERCTCRLANVSTTSDGSWTITEIGERHFTLGTTVNQPVFQPCPLHRGFGVIPPMLPARIHARCGCVDGSISRTALLANPMGAKWYYRQPIRLTCHVHDTVDVHGTNEHNRLRAHSEWPYFGGLPKS